MAVGLGALHHIALARELSRETRAQEAEKGGSADAAARGALSFYLDFSLYAANDLAFANLSSLLPGVAFSYEYLEASRARACEGMARTEGGELPEWAAPIGEGFEPPLFQSLGCAYKHRAHGGSCPANCDRSWSLELKDRDRRYRLIVEDCVTMLFRSGGGAGL